MVNCFEKKTSNYRHTSSKSYRALRCCHQFAFGWNPSGSSLAPPLKGYMGTCGSLAPSQPTASQVTLFSGSRKERLFKNDFLRPRRRCNMVKTVDSETILSLSYPKSPFKEMYLPREIPFGDTWI